MLPLCDDITLRASKLEDPGRCSTEKNVTKNISSNSLQTCKSVFEFAGNCILQKSGDTYMYFISCILNQVKYQVVDVETCERALGNHYCDQGRLLSENDRKLTNRIEITRTNTRVKTVNFILAIMSITKDITTNECFHITLGRLKCRKEEKFSISESWTIVYKESFEKNCETALNVSNTTFVLHSTTKGVL